MPKTTYFTSESVCAGHPDKLCDQISDAILDAALTLDPNSHTAIESVVGANKIALFGEVKSHAELNFQKIAVNKIKELGYTNPAWGFSIESDFSNDIHKQSPEIAIGVDHDGAGDQGMMFGFAVKESSELMPLPITIAHALTKQIDSVRESGQLKWLRPDGKAQVTLKYEDNVPIAIEKIVVAAAHSEKVDNEKVKYDITKAVIEPVIDRFEYGMPPSSSIIVNGTGVWHIPGPASDAGLTGRKIVVDTYGGYARVGGGAFSGKDPSKVDRSGAYAARYIAKNIVAHGLATKCEVGFAYVIGKPKPLMQTIETFGTETASSKAIEDFKDKLLDTSVRGIIDGLKLKQPIYSSTAVYGHFGKVGLPWENIAKSI